ncbi:HAD family hydrolase [Candidatus Vondammii sp. HM_W22]|uniref:HAD family hydrolase n=1 Tax=Candidatus Vondammii sp. HM_W22 TaxID=2687299 RepID=UPI001F143B92|nr:HAD family hydrolase [Candidatus Vondammii sp. HM_W22]
MANLKALLFDVDGTLANTERDGHRVAFNTAFKEAGLDWHWDEPLYGALLKVTGGKERVRHYLEKFNREFEKPDNLDQFIASLHQSKTRCYVELLEKGAIPLRNGVRRLLKEAENAGMRMAVVTTTTPENVAALLENSLGHGSEAPFEVIAAGDVVPAKKPAPDIYTWAMEQLNLKPEQCLAVEDSDNGLRSALSSGVRSVVVTVNGYTQGESFDNASLVVDQLGEQPGECSKLAGDFAPVSIIDLDLLKKLHGAVWE